MPALSKLELCKLLPHGDTMCLLDAVESWNTSAIVCTSMSHREKDNPLRNRNRLHAICGLEYAAQAMAVHVSLTSPLQDISAAVGYLGGVRDLQIAALRLDTYRHPLKISGTLLFSQEYNFMYYFKIESDQEELLCGRASIFIQPASLLA